MKLKFYRDKKRWYIDLPNSKFFKAQLEMVSGADELCEMYSSGKGKLEVDVSTEPIKGYDQYVKLKSKFWQRGRFYQAIDCDFVFWLCPVTKFVFGRYPSNIFISSI